MIPDPLTLLEELEALRRSLRPGEHLNPNRIEPFVAVLARAVVSPESVDAPRMDYRVRSVRDALLARLGRMYGASIRNLRLDVSRAISVIQDEQLDQIRQDEVEMLEGWLTL